MSARDYRAWQDIYKKLDDLAGDIESVKARIRNEIGFEHVHVSRIQPGDRVRSHMGDFHDVDRVVRRSAASPPCWRIYFEDDEGAMDVEDVWDENPWPPMVTRSYEPDTWGF